MFIKNGYPDIVYFVKPSEDNDELKYSLRSLKNLNHGQVYLVGYRPSWVDKKYEFISTNQNSDKYQNVRNNWLAALTDERISDDFVLMNDDFFIMQPTKNIPVLRRLKNIEHYINIYSKLKNDGRYVTEMKQARDILNSWGFSDISSYELHTPMLINKKKMLNLLSKFNGCTSQLRTIYGNYYNIGGKKIIDVKIIRDDQDNSFDTQFISTIDESFKDGKIGHFLRKKFAKVLIFSHANDPDGLLSVILAQLAFAEVDYLLTNNPQSDITKYLDQKKTSLGSYDFIFICDIYPGLPVLKKIPDAHWFDHKNHSLEKIKQHNLKLKNTHIATEVSGVPASASSIFYRWLVKEKLLGREPSSFVEFVRQVDTWDFK